MRTPLSKNKKGLSIFGVARGDQGFTLIEVLVSLAIFSIAITGVITVAIQGGMTTNMVRNKVVAKYLADEAIELTRALRDTDILGAGATPTATAGVIWDADFGSPTATLYNKCSTTHACDIDVRNANPSSPSDAFPVMANVRVCPTGSLCQLYFDDTTGTYYNDPAGMTGGVLPPSPFKRGIVIVPTTTTGSVMQEMKVTVTVSWYEGTYLRSMSESESLYNWYP